MSSPLEPSGRVGNVIRTTPGDLRLSNQQHLPRGLSSFEQPMRLRCLRERELAVDADLQPAALDPAQHLARPREQLGARCDVVHDRGTGEEERALLVQHLRVEQPHRSARLRSEEHTSELQSLAYLVCRLLLEKKKSRPFRASPAPWPAATAAPP